MITASEHGRSLVLMVGDPTIDGIEITIPPVNAKVGAAVFALWVGVLFAQSEQPEIDAENFSRLSVGRDNWDVIQGSTPNEDGTLPEPFHDGLRWAEAHAVINAAFFWNVQGGSIERVQELLNEELGGFPKARQNLLTENGLWEPFELLQTLLSGESANPTLSLDGTPDTSSPSGTGSSSNSTVDRLPSNRRSIHQDA